MCDWRNGRVPEGHHITRYGLITVPACNPVVDRVLGFYVLAPYLSPYTLGPASSWQIA
jgi:hypothetical protein